MFIVAAKNATEGDESMNFLLANFGYVWLGLLVIFMIFEGATTALVTIWFALGSLAAVITSFITDNVFIQAAVFLAVSVITLLVARPLVRNHKKRAVATNADSVIGKLAVITEEVNNIQNSGALYIDGKVWTARSESGEVLPVDTPVTVVRIEGVKLIVKKA